MLDKELTWFVYCDHCANFFDTDEDFFDMAIEAVKKEGWRLSMKEGAWSHTCRVCQAKEEYKDFDVV